MKPLATNTDLRASFALGTVKKRIMMCGSPAVPNISASPNETADIGSLMKLPGPMIDRPFAAAAAGSAPAALASLTNAVAKHDGAVSNLKVVSRQQDFFEVLLDVEVRDLRHLLTVIAGLRGAPGITQVERARG